jgi:hypothetical protein
MAALCYGQWLRFSLKKGKRRIEMNIDNKSAEVVMTKGLLTCGVIAGPLFVITFLIEGATRANYNPLRHPVSSLALGDFGWTQIANFMIAGLLTLAFALGLRLTLRAQKGSTWGPLLVAIWGIGLLGAGVFLTDPVSGYPPGTPDLLVNTTAHGELHDSFSLAGFLALTAACFVFSYRFIRQGKNGWAIYSTITGILFPIGIVLASAGFSQAEGLVAFGGLVQRLTVTIGWTWLTLLAVYLLRAWSERTSRLST